MLPLADTHVHLLAGLDDGPRDADEALAMCRMLVAEGCRTATALAHQNLSWPANDADRLKAAATELSARLKEHKIPLTVYPTGEVMLSPELVADWKAGRLLSYGGHGKFLLVEMPHGLYVDVRPFAAELRPLGVRLVVAHAERYPELLHEVGAADRLVAAGCLIQVTASEIAAPSSGRVERSLRDWAKRGVIHLLGSDGHRLGGREPRMKAGYEALARWVGTSAADRAGGIWGPAILQGQPVNVPQPVQKPRSWFARLFGG
ncbi:MAG TPA: CpsB/CapC family capsule biosynthesis tyrosine phosphatase [Fimbriiglobus sp.]|nr:CpsB/CapC family capsule biosynthesis tyrosine phosphatase [Fimbriiglobus sp.]